MMTNALEKFSAPMTDSEMLKERMIEDRIKEGVIGGGSAGGLAAFGAMELSDRKRKAQAKKGRMKPLSNAKINARTAGLIGLMAAGGLAGGLAAENYEKKRLAGKDFFGEQKRDLK